MSAAVRNDEGEVLRQASAVVGRPVVLWEIIGPHRAVPRAASGTDIGATPPDIDLDAILQKWSVPVAVGSRWVAAAGVAPGTWVVAPVRSRPPEPPPGGKERRSRERLALELAGLALGAIVPGRPTPAGAAPEPTSGMLVHQASNPLTAARAGLQLAMESVGRWVDLAADRRLMLLDDLGQVLEDIDRTNELLRAVRERGTTRGATPAGRPERFDAVRVVRSCLTLERRLLRDRGIDLEFTSSLEQTYLKGDPNALFDLLVTLVRNAADVSSDSPSPVVVSIGQKGKELELTVRGRGAVVNLEKVRTVAESAFEGRVSVETKAGGTSCTILLPLPPQRVPRQDTY